MDPIHAKADLDHNTFKQTSRVSRHDAPLMKNSRPETVKPIEFGGSIRSREKIVENRHFDGAAGRANKYSNINGLVPTPGYSMPTRGTSNRNQNGNSNSSPTSLAQYVNGNR